MILTDTSVPVNYSGEKELAANILIRWVEDIVGAGRRVSQAEAREARALAEAALQQGVNDDTIGHLQLALDVDVCAVLHRALANDPKIIESLNVRQGRKRKTKN